MQTQSKKVICVGLPKTGTTSIGKAFEILGYTHNPATDSFKAFQSVMNYDMGYIKEQLKKYDSFEDTPYHFPLVYEWCMKNYDCKFVLTVRSSNNYLNSLMNETDRKKEGSLHRLKKVCQFGIDSVENNKQDVLDYYHWHNNYAELVLPNICIMNLEDGDGWEKLCKFLNKPIPAEPFPHLNKTK